MKRILLSGLLSSALLFSLCTCQKKEEKKISPLGIIAENQETASSYDLDQIQEAGELIAITLSGPDTYYEYRGKGFGLQFELAESFASSIGVKLRMEIARDTAEMLNKLNQNEVDLIALEIPVNQLHSKDLTFSGTWSKRTDRDSPDHPRQWVVRREARLLAEALNKWYHPQLRSSLLAVAQNRFSRNTSIKRRMNAPILNSKKGIISPYDAQFIRHSQAIGWDWRLMAAQCYQESGFDPQAVSWAGACGLMQIMPETAAHLGLPLSRIHDPDLNITAAARYLHELNDSFNDVPGRLDRISFVLAAYNGGSGHVRDAMALARKYGKNPYGWNDVAYFILRLSQPQYYNDEVVRYGYLRGQETYEYVTSIHERWQRYRKSVHGTISPAMPSPAKRNLRKGFRTKVLTPEELEAKSKQEQVH